MNKFLMIDAISCLDTDLLAEHLERKERFQTKSSKRKRSKIMKWSAAIVACITLIIIAIPTISNLIGYQSNLPEEEIFERSNTYFSSYGELVSIIGDDTLLKNIDFSTLTDYELRLSHELDNVNEYHTVIFVENISEDSFGLSIHFPPYQNKTQNLVDNGDTIEINGITVNYKNRVADGAEEANYQYYYVAEFEYDGCCYQVRSMGYSDENVFWNNLNELLGNKI